MVTVCELHSSQTVVTGSSSVTVTVAGFGETTTVAVVPMVLTTVICAEKADEADAPEPPSTGTTDHVGLLARASRPCRFSIARGAARAVKVEEKKIRAPANIAENIFAMRVG